MNVAGNGGQGAVVVGLNVILVAEATFIEAVT